MSAWLLVQVRELCHTFSYLARWRWEPLLDTGEIIFFIVVETVATCGGAYPSGNSEWTSCCLLFIVRPAAAADVTGSLTCCFFMLTTKPMLLYLVDLRFFPFVLIGGRQVCSCHKLFAAWSMPSRVDFVAVDRRHVKLIREELAGQLWQLWLTSKRWVDILRNQLLIKAQHSVEHIVALALTLRKIYKWVGRFRWGWHSHSLK